jgi:hypothetical protein
VKQRRLEQIIKQGQDFHPALVLFIFFKNTSPIVYATSDSEAPCSYADWALLYLFLLLR